MICRKCRKEIPDDAKYCPYCRGKQGVRQNVKSRGNGTGSAYQLQNGKWIAVRTLGYEMDAEVSGVQRRKYTPHSCRHTFATLMKRVPGAEKDKLELMGHTSGEMLRHYQDVTYADLRKITDAI